jgi:hypothetical protein
MRAARRDPITSHQLGSWQFGSWDLQIPASFPFGPLRSFERALKSLTEFGFPARPTNCCFSE